MINIRQAVNQDAEGLSQLSFQLGYPCSVDDCLVFLQELDKDPDQAVFVAVKEPGNLVGFAHTFITKRLFTEPFAELGGLVVDEGHRRTGIGESLLRVCEDWAVDQNCGKIRIRSDILREHAREFYLSLGYKTEKEQTVFCKDFLYPYQESDQ